jgi:ribose transport system permease protein
MSTVEKPDVNSGAAAASTAAEPRSRFQARTLWFTVGPFAVFLVFLVIVSVLQPSFLAGGGLKIASVQATPILLVALGQMAVLLVGSIDLSNAAMALLSAVILAKTLGSMGAVAPLVCLIVVTAIGVINGLLVVYTQVPSFALTLGTLGILQAASLFLTKATTVYASSNTGVVTWLFQTFLVFIPAAFWVGVILAVVFWVVLRMTPIGLGMTAVGLNETGAMFSGLNTRLIKVTAFALSGFFAGVAGITIIAQAGAASSFGLGSDLLLPGIAAAMVGGTAITGGVANPINVVFGGLIVALIPIACAAIGIPATAQSLVYGLVIIIAVALTMSRSHAGVVK